MTRITHLTLDVLKPHQPDIVEFATRLAAHGTGSAVTIQLLEMDEQTESLEVRIDGDDIDYEGIKHTIGALGGSLHSVDCITVDVKTKS